MNEITLLFYGDMSGQTLLSSETRKHEERKERTKNEMTNTACFKVSKIMKPKETTYFTSFVSGIVYNLPPKEVRTDLYPILGY